MPRIIFRDDNSARGQKPTSDIHCRIKVAARIAPQVEYELRVTRLHEFPQSLPSDAELHVRSFRSAYFIHRRARIHTSRGDAVNFQDPVATLYASPRGR